MGQVQSNFYVTTDSKAKKSNRKSSIKKKRIFSKILSNAVHSTSLLDEESKALGLHLDDIPMEGNFVKSFHLEQDEKEICKFFQHYGFVVIKNVLNQEQINTTIEDVWNVILGKDKTTSPIYESLNNFHGNDFKPVDRNDPTTWTVENGWPDLDTCGLLGNHPIFSKTALENRQNENVYKSFQLLFNFYNNLSNNNANNNNEHFRCLNNNSHSIIQNRNYTKQDNNLMNNNITNNNDCRLWCSHDRYGVIKPTKNVTILKGNSIKTKDFNEYKINEDWLHWKLNPWILQQRYQTLKSNLSNNTQQSSVINNNNNSVNNNRKKKKMNVDEMNSSSVNCEITAYQKLLKNLKKETNRKYFLNEDYGIFPNLKEEEHKTTSFSSLDYLSGDLKLEGMINLVDSTVQDGGIKLIPCFHRHENFLFWTLQTFNKFSKKTSHQDSFVKLPNNFSLQKFAVPIPMEAGSLIIWDSRIPNCTYSNNSNRFHMSQYIRMFKSDKYTNYGDEVFALRGKKVKEMLPNDFEPSELGRKIFGLEKW
ncbi:hypothetical protein ABK040_011519 [Willaertia magna]